MTRAESAIALSLMLCIAPPARPYGLDRGRGPAAFRRSRRSAVAHRDMKRVGETVPLRRLRRTELPVDTVELAHYLIGKVAVHDTDDGRLSGRIVETEAFRSVIPQGTHFGERRGA